jgi:6-phosphofructokinase 2
MVNPSRSSRRPSGNGAHIVTLTLSPALDIATQIPRLCPDAKLRCSTPVYAPGGGGINVARAIHILGGRALALLPAGGSTGRHLIELLDAEGVPNQALAIADWTRECLNVVERASAQQYRFIMPGARLSPAEQAQLLGALAALPALDYLVISGSLPEGLAADFLPRVLQGAARRGARCILDSSGEALRQALEVGGVYLIKPNFSELSSLVGQDIGGPQQLASVAQELVQAGKCETVLVSLGAQGALLVRAGLSERIPAPTVRRRSTVGAGDSMVAAVTLKLAAGADWRDAARYGVAAGTAAIMTEGSELCRRHDTEQLYAWLQAYGQG